MANYPYTQATLLNNGVTATTVVSLNAGMQSATTTFTSAAGNLGAITLSPVQTQANNVHLSVSKQDLLITNQSFQAAFGLNSGQVFSIGTITDLKGENPEPFSKLICQWS